MSMMYVAAAATVIAGATSAYAQYQQGQAEREIADTNARFQKQSADMALQKGATEAAEHRQKVRQMIARQNAAISAGGVVASTGTALDVMTETSGIGELDALRIMNNAQRTAWGYETAAEGEKYRGRMAARGATLNAVGTLLGSAGSAAGSFKKTG